MLRKISCKQVQAIMPFYLKNSVNPILCEIIEEHLEQCEKCRNFYLNAIEKFENGNSSLEDNVESLNVENNFKTKEYQNFKQKLSAYLDSELDDNENIKIKKMTIANPLARKDLENMYSFKRLLHLSFERTKEKCKYDFSKQIIKKITKNNSFSKQNIINISYLILFLSIVLTISILM